MLDGFLAHAGDYIHTNPWLALAAVFVGGLVTASNPCVLASIPLMMSVVAGRRDDRPAMGRAFVFSLVFILGLAVTFTVLGMVAALAGRMYGGGPGLWNWVAAAVCVLMGLHLTGIIAVPIPTLGGRVRPASRGLAGALLLGLLFGFVSAPCAAPILVVLLAYLAGSGSSVAWGALLLLVYAMGHSVLILVAGTSMGAARVLLEHSKATRALGVLRQAAGAAIILLGVYLAYGAIGR